VNTCDIEPFESVPVDHVSELSIVDPERVVPLVLSKDPGKPLEPRPEPVCGEPVSSFRKTTCEPCMSVTIAAAPEVGE